MLLAVDIGNTNISFGVFGGNRIVKRFDIPTKNYNLKKLKYSLGLPPHQCIGGGGKVRIEDAVICSVVPQKTKILAKDLERLSGSKPYIIGKQIRVPIKNLYRILKQVGQDRLVNAYAGVRLYGAPLIVVDFGTAITFDVISKDKEYLGGMILPGLSISLDALAERTALLPKIKLQKPKEFIGRDTRSSMLSGIVFGFAALTDDLIERIRKRIGRHARAIGTGGNIGLIGRYCRKLDKIDRDLTLKGLSLIYNNLDPSAFGRRIKQNFH